MKHSWFVLYSSWLVCLAGCEVGAPRATQSPVGENASKVIAKTSKSETDALIVQPSIVFTRKNLRVCFRTPTIPEGDRRVIADAANEWSRATGVTFSGFGNCTVPVSNAEIGIIQDESTLFTGRAFGGNPYGAIDLNFTYANWPATSGPAFCRTSATAREGCLHATAVHELGHVLGFAHEQLRTDPLLGLSSCSTQPADGALANYTVGPWDLYSVMNYCNPNVSEVLNLSETDKAGAQREYGRPDFFADVDADGRADAINVLPTGIVARFSTGSSFGSVTTLSSTAFVGDHGTHFADVDGDRRADVIAVNAGSVMVRRSVGRGLFLPAETWDSAIYGRHGTFFADVTGDGAADAISVSEDSVVVRRAIPQSRVFAAAEFWLSSIVFPLDTAVLLNGSPWRHIPFSISIQFGDVTGDLSPQGKPMADLVLFRRGTTLVFRSTGSAFEVPSLSGPGSLIGNRGTFLSDVNGDGRKDAVVVNSRGIDDTFNGQLNGMVVRLAGLGSAGTVWQGAVSSQIGSRGEFLGNHGTYFANVDGLPGDEAIAVSSNRIIVRRRVAAPPAGTPLYGAEESWLEDFHPRPIGLTLSQANPTMWNPTTGVWSISSNAGEQWGAPGDVPVSGDFDGDQQLDIAVWRPNGGTWFVLKSSDGAVMTQQWGTTGDIPVPADYDGDGLVDFAIWRPSEGYWYVRKSTNGATLVRQWGQEGDVPVPGRYDGDTRTDFAVWRPGADGPQSYYLWVRSSDGVIGSQPWGTIGDIPVPGDYDGNGVTDFAVWRPGDGFWFTKSGIGGAESSVQWGTQGDIPIPGRYHEGDNRTDYAVWRPSSGTWFLRNSATGVTGGGNFGTAGETPIPRK